VKLGRQIARCEQGVTKVAGTFTTTKLKSMAAAWKPSSPASSSPRTMEASASRRRRPRATRRSRSSSETRSRSRRRSRRAVERSRSATFYSTRAPTTKRWSTRRPARPSA